MHKEVNTKAQRKQELRRMWAKEKAAKQAQKAAARQQLKHDQMAAAIAAKLFKQLPVGGGAMKAEDLQALVKNGVSSYVLGKTSDDDSTATTHPVGMR